MAFHLRARVGPVTYTKQLKAPRKAPAHPLTPFITALLLVGVVLLFIAPMLTLLVWAMAAVTVLGVAVVRIHRGQ